MEKLNLAIIGQGRSGRDIHGAYYLSNDNKYYSVKYVVEADDERRKRALERYEGCRVFSDYSQLLGKKDINLVVDASYSEQHFANTKALLENGFNVLVDKPFAATVLQCNTLIKIARERRLTLAVFQQSMFAPFYIKVKEIVNSNQIGKIEQISIRYNGFSRRWDWQTLQKRLGGNCHNTGPHPIGVALGLIDFDKNAKVVFSKLSKTQMSSGDADDYCKIIICAPDRPVIDIEINNTDAFSDYNVKLQGTKGTYKSTVGNYKLKYLNDGENPERLVVPTFLSDENGNPAYCLESLKFREEEGAFKGTAFDVGTAKLYEELYFAISAGKPLTYPPETLKDIVGVMEKVYAQNPLELKY